MIVNTATTYEIYCKYFLLIILLYYHILTLSSMKAFLNSKITLVLLLIAIGGLSVSITNLMPEVLSAYQRIQTYENKIAAQQQDLNRLKQIQPHLQSEEFIKSQTKLKLNYKEPEEVVITIADIDSSTSNADNNGQNKNQRADSWADWAIALLTKIFLEN